MGIRESHILKDAVKTAEVAINAIGTEEMIDGAVTTPKIGDLQVTNPKVADATLVKGKLAANTIQWVEEIVLSGEILTVAADTVGTPRFGDIDTVLLGQHKQSAKSAQLVISFTWAATADGTIQLYDATAAAVRAESAAFTGGETSRRTAISVPLANLVPGNTLYMRANVTVAGAAGETVTLRFAKLEIVCGAS